MNGNKHLTISEQKYFFTHQLTAMEDEYNSYLHGNMNKHFVHKDAFLGKIVGFDSKRANLLVKFKQGFVPRLEFQYQGSVFSGINGDVGDLTNWQFTVKSFFENNIRMSSELFSVFSMPTEESQSLIVGFKDVDSLFLDKVLPIIRSGKKISIAIIKNPPPYRYLLNLKNFVSKNANNQLLNISLQSDLSTWKPNVLTCDGRVELIARELELYKELIIQGPPGTGKSQLISQVTNHFLDKNLSVCITSLTNKTLVEICTKHELASACLRNKVYKTSLKENEKLDAPGLQLTQNQLYVNKGELLLSTFYALSEAFSENSISDFYLFDVLIIEEASQAFLPTIAAFKKLANKILLVGDPMQMAPIVLNKEQLLEENINYDGYTKGLASIASNTDINSYFLDKTYRLSPASANQTSVFYNNRLISHQKDNYPLKVPSQFQDMVNSSKENQKCCRFNLENPQQLQEAITLSIKLLDELMRLNPQSKFCILSPYRKIVTRTQDYAARNLESTKNIVIETVDRIQGITVDFCILLLPLKKVSFELNKERFNVATSRSTNGTLIFIGEHFNHYGSISKEVRDFLNNAKTIR